MNTLGEDGYKDTFIARLVIRFLEASLYWAILNLSIVWTSPEEISCFPPRVGVQGTSYLAQTAAELHRLRRVPLELHTSHLTVEGRKCCRGFPFLGLPILLILGCFLMRLPWVSEHVAPLGGAIFSYEPHLFVSNFFPFSPHPSPTSVGLSYFIVIDKILFRIMLPLT